MLVFVVLGAATFAASGLGERLFSMATGRAGPAYAPEGIHELNLSQTIEGITVALDRAYVDGDRIGIEYTVSGLHDQDVVGPDRTYEVYRAILTDSNGAAFPTVSGAGLRGQSDILDAQLPPGTVKMVTVFEASRARAGASGLELQFSVSVVEVVTEAPSEVVAAEGRGGNTIASAGRARIERELGPVTFNFTVASS